MARQKEFDQEKALRKAVRLFSQQGFAATSTDELMRVMNVGRQSMYDTFGDKRALFLRALEMYVTESVKSINAEFEKPGSVAGVVGNFVSGYRQFGDELFTSGLWAEQDRRGDADTAQCGADQHRDRKSQLPVDSKIGDDRCNQAAEDRALVIDEAGRRRAYLGRESFGEIGRVSLLSG